MLCTYRKAKEMDQGGKMNLPKELKYTKDHEWGKVAGDIATIGITDFAQHQLTDVVFVELPSKGKQVNQHEKTAVVESVKSVSDIFTPLSGEVIEINQKLIDAPELINKDCYGEGWIFKLKMKDKKEFDKLMSAEEYKKVTG
jgi:glycine cleavage system H protein